MRNFGDTENHDHDHDHEIGIREALVNNEEGTLVNNEEDVFINNEEGDVERVERDYIARYGCLACLGCVFSLLILSLFIYLYLHKTRELNG